MGRIFRVFHFAGSLNAEITELYSCDRSQKRFTGLYKRATITRYLLTDIVFLIATACRGRKKKDAWRGFIRISSLKGEETWRKEYE